MKQSILAILMVLVCGLIVMAAGNAGDPSLPATANDYKILAPITHGDLTIFPVVSDKIHDTSNFITLDEGIRSGDVVVTEVGNLHSSMRRRPPYQARPYSGAEVNRLVLVNNSRHPLILLAGEVVTGGKQDRVVGKDRIVPAESDPVDLSVFCVEHGRWTESSTNFGTKGSIMLQPSVRMKAMADQDQQKVWDAVGQSRTAMAAVVPAKPPAIQSGTGVGSGSGSGSAGGNVANSTVEVEAYASSVRELNSTTSYAKARDSMAVKQQVDSITEPMQ